MNEKQELVTMARELERLLARRRKLAKKVADLDDHVRLHKIAQELLLRCLRAADGRRRHRASR